MRKFRCCAVLALVFLLCGCGAAPQAPEPAAGLFDPEEAAAVETEVLPEAPDLDHDGEAEALELRTYAFEGAPGYELRVVRTDGTLLWSEQAALAHVGYNGVYLCPVDGKDYLLRYHPTMYQGYCDYSYQLFSLDGSGGAELLRENAVSFDLDFGREGHSFDPAAIAAFVEKVHGYLEDSAPLLVTDEALGGAEQGEADDLWWLGEARAEGGGLREALEDFAAREAAAAGEAS